MVTRLQGRVNGSDIIFSRVEGDLWECTVPAPEAFEAVVELCAYDEAGNYCYAARYYLLFDPESLEIRLLPIDYWLEVTGRDMWLDCVWPIRRCCIGDRRDGRMIDFILGEHRYVKFVIRSRKKEEFAVKEAAYELYHDGNLESSEACEVLRDGSSLYLKIMLQPAQRSKRYRLFVTYQVGQETIKHVEDMEVR